VNECCWIVRFTDDWGEVFYVEDAETQGLASHRCQALELANPFVARAVACLLRGSENDVVRVVRISCHERRDDGGCGCEAEAAKRLIDRFPADVEFPPPEPAPPPNPVLARNYQRCGPTCPLPDAPCPCLLGRLK
jgi:hypothetical protein